MDVRGYITHLAYDYLVLLIGLLALLALLAVGALPLRLGFAYRLLDQACDERRIVALVMVPVLASIALQCVLLIFCIDRNLTRDALICLFLTLGFFIGTREHFVEELGNSLFFLWQPSFSNETRDIILAALLTERNLVLTEFHGCI